MNRGMKFRKKPVVIEAYQFLEWSPSCLGVCSGGSEIEYPHIHTLEGILKVSVGDWIIKGINGEFYPCKPNIFEKTYEAVSY